MQKLRKIAGITALTLGALALILTAVVEVRSRRTFDAPYPAIHASNDPTVIARGRYLVYGAGHCVNCHVDKSEQESLLSGNAPPLAGGLKFGLPVGDLYTPNLTPDRETGIGRYT